MDFEKVPQVVLALGKTNPQGMQLLGACFALGGKHFATARHVVGNSDEGLQLVLPRSQTLSAYQDTTDQQVKMAAASIEAVDPVRDLCVLSIDGGIDVGYELGSTDEVGVGAPVTVFGFPHSDQGRLVLTQQDANVGARVLIEASGIKSKHIVLNTQARPGQSGGPVFDPTTGRVVAVLIGSYAPGGGGGISLGGVDPHTLHQTTHAVSAEYLKDMV